MLSKEDFMVIQALVRRGVYQRDIAARLGECIRGRCGGRAAHHGTGSIELRRAAPVSAKLHRWSRLGEATCPPRTLPRPPDLGCQSRARHRPS